MITFTVPSKNLSLAHVLHTVPQSKRAHWVQKQIQKFLTLPRFLINSNKLTNDPVLFRQCPIANSRSLKTLCHFCSNDNFNPKSLTARHQSWLPLNGRCYHNNGWSGVLPGWRYVHLHKSSIHKQWSQTSIIYIISFYIPTRCTPFTSKCPWYPSLFLFNCFPSLSFMLIVTHL